MTEIEILNRLHQQTIKLENTETQLCKVTDELNKLKFQLRIKESKIKQLETKLNKPMELK